MINKLFTKLHWRVKTNINSIIAFLALILSIIGTYIIWNDSQNSISALAELLRETTSTVGYWQDEPVSKEKIESFNQSLQQAANLDIKGFILLMCGFGLQIINLFISKQSKKEFNRHIFDKSTKHHKFKGS